MTKKFLAAAVLSALVALPLGLRAADVREGLVSYWPFETFDTSARTSPDLVTGNDFVASEGMYEGDILDDPERGKVLNVGEIDEGGLTYQVFMYFQTPAGTDTGLPISQNAAWTAMCWVKGAFEGQDDRRVFSESSSQNTDPLVNIGTHNAATDGTVDLFFRNGGATVNHFHSTGTAYDGTWHHVALTYQDDLLTLYIDGELDSTVPHTPGDLPFDITSVGAILRGAELDNIGFIFTGQIDDLALWERALTQVEVQEVIANETYTPVPQAPPTITIQPVGRDLIFGDSWVMSVEATGTHPMSFQWQKELANLAGETGKTLTITDAQPGDSGSYTCVVSNGSGSETSAAAVVTVTDWPDPDLPNGMLCYWPLDEIVGSKTPDIRSWYDMELVNLSGADLVPGRWGSCFQFTGADATLLQRLHQPEDELPIYPYPSFTVSLWVNGGLLDDGVTIQDDLRVFSEGSISSTQPLFNIGTHDGQADGSVDTYIRSNSGGSSGHQHTQAIAFDNSWHHIVYVQRTLGEDLTGVLYVDGQLDPVPAQPVRPLTLNTTTIGGIRRGSPSHWWTGLIDDVALWSRALSPDEVTELFTSGTPIPEQRLRPLQVSTFTSDLPAVKTADPVKLSWDVSADATVRIDQNVGDVTGLTSAGSGSIVVNVPATTTYTLTIARGDEELTAQTTVAAVSGVADNWSLLDNFEQYAPGALGDTVWWLDLRDSSRVVDAGGNKMLEVPEDVDSGDAATVLPLSRLELLEGESRTVFFRVQTPEDIDVALRQYVGITDKNLRWHGDADESGPMLIVAADGAGGAMQIGTRQGAGSTTDEWYPDLTASANTLYNVWIDVENRSIVDGDLFSIHIQEDGDADRVTLFQDYVSNRSPDGSVELGQTLPDLDKVYVSGAETATLRYDDFYISNSGLNSTVPRAMTIEGPTIDVSYDGGQLTLSWPSGTLESADTVDGTYEAVQGAGAPSHTVTPSEAQRFYRVSN